MDDVDEDDADASAVAPVGEAESAADVVAEPLAPPIVVPLRAVADARAVVRSTDDLGTANDEPSPGLVAVELAAPVADALGPAYGEDKP